MSLILRVDVDKPYGRANIFEKILSKVSENYWLPSISSMGYLRHLKEFLSYLSDEKISSHIYFRTCTLPPKEWLNTKLLTDHSLGYHAENTKDFSSFKNEFENIQSHFGDIKLTSFTKHGSGEWKSGKYHYPVYEPDKYLKWAKMTGLPFHFGNEEVLNSSGFRDDNNYYPGMFWIDRSFNDNSDKFKWVIDIALNNNVVVIIHPSNYAADVRVKRNMEDLISLARKNEVPWITL